MLYSTPSMAIIEVHRSPIYRRHYANVCSETGIYCVLQGFLLIFLPLIIAWNSGGGSQFWTTNRFTYSQPKVEYTYTVLAEYRGFSDTGNTFVLSFSTSNILASLQGNDVRQSIFQSAEFDDNNDGLTDRFEFGNQVPLNAGEHVTGATWLFFFQVFLYDQIMYSFDALGVYTYDGSVPLRGLNAQGPFIFEQSDILLSKGGTYVPYINSPLLPNFYSREVSGRSVSIKNLLMSYGSRNFSMQFVPHVQSVTPFPDRPLLLNKLNFFNASITINVPQQPIRYSPPASELLKDAWIQYLSFFLVVWFLIYHINAFIYSHNLIRTYQIIDAVKEKTG